MREYLVVETIAPTGTIENIYVPMDAEPTSVENGFKAMVDDGYKLTGTVSVVEQANDGSFVRRINRAKAPLYVGGYRTASAFLRPA